ncbi:hypothetical protein HDU67_010428, partial [Dinochytrium kinnereticum]
MASRTMPPPHPSPSTTLQTSTSPPSTSTVLKLSLLPHRDPTRTQPSAGFDPIEKQMCDGHILKIGRQVKPNAPAEPASANDEVVSPTTPVDPVVGMLSTAMAGVVLGGQG